MNRFENAQVGDLVYCRIKGNGVIKNIDYYEKYFPLICFFEKYDCNRRYTLDGRHGIYCEEPTLFYRKDEEKYLTERPKPEIDWSKVPEGTIVKVSDRIENLYKQKEKLFMGYYPSLKHKFWTFDCSLFKTATGHEYCELAELCKPEWIKK